MVGDFLLALRARSALILAVAATALAAQHVALADESAPSAPADNQADREAALANMLTGATLEGSFTSTTPGRAPQRLQSDKYTLGEVRKLQGNTWLFQARIQYRDADAVMIPLPLPIEWAGDTPVVVVDNVTIPGLGTFSARVLFFDDHYAGYWKHDDRGGHLFGVIRRPDAQSNQEAPANSP